MYLRTSRRAGVMLAAVAVTATMLVTPAQASTTSIHSTISAAEAAVPAATVTPDITSVAPAPAGAGVRLGGLDVAFDGGGATSTSGELLLSGGSSMTYAADDLGEGNARLSAVLQNSSARASWTFRGAELQTFTEAGIQTISVVKDNELVGTIEAPWAVDANGVAVPTHYEVRGPKLIQVVETDANTAFPVVADPTVKTRWYGFTWYFTKNESYIMMGNALGCVGLLNKSPHPAGKALALGCGVFAGISTGQLAGGKCLRVNHHPLPGNAMYPWFGTC
ncbi:hypothetical protein [Aquipuribacter hungaricus]|uniref:Uncharacterized protein n=1 Tax=Aquipuribacter hungaricus TaxID=545624 RepID=A0ABV7WCN2_9MICO